MPRKTAQPNRMHHQTLQGRCKAEQLPDDYYNKIPPDIFGPRSVLSPVTKYSPSFMTDMFGAGVPEEIHRAESVYVEENYQGTQHRIDSTVEVNTKERVIFDPHDDRRIVSLTTMPPWRSVCRIETHMTNGAVAFGTAWFAAPNIVVTAGHCLYDVSGTEPAAIVVAPGLSDTSYPYGSETSFNISVPEKWVSHKDNRYDFGIIVLPTKQLGNMTGWFGYAVPKDSHLGNMLVHSSGYPDDHGNDTQVSCMGRVKDFSRHFIHHNIDTVRGQSGSPIFHKHQNGNRTVIGIHTDSGKPGNPNIGVRITGFIFDEIARAVQQNP